MKEKEYAKLLSHFNWQGHRGARGMLPENTIPSFLKALEYPVKSLELDVVVSKDERIIVSHDPCFSHHICTKPNGNPVLKSEEDSLLIYQMDYEMIQTYDCGSRGNEHFDQQEKMSVHKPSFIDMVKAVESHCKKSNRTLPYYNIELKSKISWYDKQVPLPAKFAELMLKELYILNIQARANLQCFDLNVLREIHKQDQSISTALLIEGEDTLEKGLAQLVHIPEFYSPYYMLLNEKIIEQAHEKGMLVVPWTVNEVDEMLNMIKIGVDGIITDYPNRIEIVLDHLTVVPNIE